MDKEDSKPNSIKALIAKENTYKLIIREPSYLLKILSPDSS